MFNPEDFEFYWEIDELEETLSLDQEVIPSFEEERLMTWSRENQKKTHPARQGGRHGELSSNTTPGTAENSTS